MKPLDRIRSVDRRLLVILLIVFVQMLGGSIVLPVLPLYAQRGFDLSPQAITLLVSSYFMAQFVAGPLLGRLSDVRGRLPVLIVSQIGTAVSFVMMGLAQSAVMLFAARILDGATGGNIIVAQAYITDITSKERRTEVLGYIFAAFGLGFIFGPAIGGAVSAFWGPQAPFWVAAGVTTVTVILTAFMLNETLTPEQQQINRAAGRAGISPAAVWRNRPLVLILLIAFVAQFAMGLLQSTFSLFGDAVIFAGYDRRTVDLGIGLLFATVGLTQFLTQSLLLRPLVRRFGEAALVFGGNALRVVGMVLFAIAVRPWIGVLGAIVFPLGIGVMMPSLQSLATRTVGDELRGGVLGLYQSSISLSVIFGTALGGVLFALAPAIPFWVGAALGGLALFPALVLLRDARE